MPHPPTELEAHRAVTVRNLRPSDDAIICELFGSTMLLGAAPPKEIILFDAYVHTCLGWYLTEGRRLASVAEQNGRVVGYALVCDNPDRQARWSAARAALLAVRVIARLVTGRLDATSRRFYRARFNDARVLWRAGRRPVMSMHVHLNVTAECRTGVVALALRAHADRVANDLERPGWYGEINALVGRRASALERLGMRVISRSPNLTLTELIGAPVERLTVVRLLPVAS